MLYLAIFLAGTLFGLAFANICEAVSVMLEEKENNPRG